MSLLRTSAPTRTPPSGSGSIALSGSALMSSRTAGRSTWSFIRSTIVVPPARQRVEGVPNACTALPSSDAERYVNGCRALPSLSRALRLHGGDDAHVGATATEVAAHAFPHLIVRCPARFAEQRHG